MLNKHTKRCRVNNLLMNSQYKLRTFSVYALTPQVSTHEFRKSSGNIQTKTCTLNSAVFLFIQSFVGGKELFHVLFSDTYPGIFYGKAKLTGIIFPGFHGHVQGKTSFFRILYSICKKV